MMSNISSTTMQSWRERPPSSYSIKFQNLSQLQSSTLHSDGKYQSRLFSSGDYQWYAYSLSATPTCSIDSTSLKATPPTEIYADIRFFVFNKKENKYLTIQDVDSKPFNTLKTMGGLPQVLPLDTFNDHKNGYLFDGDHCEFGVNIIVVPPPTKWEMLSFVNLPYPKFSWTINNFSKIKENPHTSNSFSMGGRKWVLKVYPKGYSTPDSKWLSIYLYLADGEILKNDEKIYVQAHVKVEDPRGSNHLTCKLNWWFNRPGQSCGWDHFVSTAELRKSYLDKKDTLNVEVEFKVVSKTNYS